MSDTLVIGTRGSALALWQAEHIKARLEKRFRTLRVELRVIKTTGDKILNQALSKIGDKGLFTKEIEQALLDGRVDLAVHSLKDLPTATPEGLHIAAVTRREDVRDALISRTWPTLAALPEGATIATGSLRRRSQLLHHRPDLRIVDIRGNLNTRFEKYDASKWDGMMLAHAGVKRLGFTARVAQVIPTSLILPAVGQGALGIETRGDDERTLRYTHVLDHAPTHAATDAERSLLRELEGGCQIPIGAYARFVAGELVLDAMVGTIDGTTRIDGRLSTTDPRKAAALGARLAARLLRGGAREILDTIRAGAEA